jgi:hypothetical protein
MVSLFGRLHLARWLTGSQADRGGAPGVRTQVKLAYLDVRI